MDEARGERVRAAEVIGALCLATDLGMGFPFEHGLHSTLIAMRLGERLGIHSETQSQTYYASLLALARCTTESWVAAEIFGDSLTRASRFPGLPSRTRRSTARWWPWPGSPI